MRFSTSCSDNASAISSTTILAFLNVYGDCKTCPVLMELVSGRYALTKSIVQGSQPHAWSIKSSALMPNMRYKSSSCWSDSLAICPIVSMPREASRAAVPRPTRQKSVIGRWFQSFSRYDISSNSAIRTPSLSAGMCLATMSIAILQRYMFVPMPAVAVMPVRCRTSRIILMASS